jgi:hypothetical protein
VANDNVIGTIRRELRRIVNVPVSQEEIMTVLRNEVIKRDNLDGAIAEMALKRVARKSQSIKITKTIETGDAAPVATLAPPNGDAVDQDAGLEEKIKCEN